MKPPPFKYARAEDSEHAAELLNELGDEARVLAGGQSLLPMMNFRLAAPAYLVDISRTADLQSLNESERGFTIRAAARYCDVAMSDSLSVLPEAIAMIGHEQIRNLGTVVGSLAHNDPSAELPAVALVAGASMSLLSASGRRELTAEAFYGDGFAYMTAAEPHELVESVTFPVVPGAAQAVVEFARRPGDFATLGVATHLLQRDGVVREIRVATFGGAPALRLHGDVDVIAIGERGSASVWEAVADAIASESFTNDVARDAYLRRLARTLVLHALERAWDRSGGTR